MLKDKENSRKQGDVGLGAAIAWFTLQGYTVCVPLTDSQKYDLITEFDGGLQKIQVKTTRFVCGGKYTVSIKTCGGNRSGNRIYVFDNSLVDYLFVLTEEGTKYLIPAIDIKATSGITLGEKYNKYII